VLFKRTEYDDWKSERGEKKQRNYGNTQTWRTLNHNFREKFTPILFNLRISAGDAWRRNSELEKCHLCEEEKLIQLGSIFRCLAFIPRTESG
jgi:hypothetical protein